MGSIADQLGLNATFFIQLAIFAVVFFALSRVYFQPFLKLFKIRHERTVADREAAEKLMAQAQAKLEEYKQRLNEERSAARKEYEAALQEARKEEATLMAQAREEARSITHATAESVAQQRKELRAAIQKDVDVLAQQVSEKLLQRKV